MADKLAEAFVELTIRVDELERGLKKAEKETESSASKMAKSAAKIGKAFLAVGAVIGVMAIKVSADFEKSMSSVKAVSGATGKAFEDMTKLARKMGATTVFTAKESADAMQFLAMAGLNANEIMEALPKTLELASAGSIDLASAADLATNVLAGMNLQVKDLGRVNDILAFTASSANTNIRELADAFRIAAPFAAGANQSIETVASILGALANRGIKAANAGQGLTQMMIRLQKAMSGAGDEVDQTGTRVGMARDVIEKFGLEIFKTNGEMRPMEEILTDISRASLSSSDKIKLFGAFTVKTATAAINAVDDINKLKDSMTGTGNEAEGVSKKMAEIKLDNFAGKMTLLKSAWDGFLTSLGDTITRSDAVNSSVETLTDSIGLMQKAIENNAEANVTLTERQGKWIQRLSKAKLGTDEYKLALGALSNASNRLEKENEELAKSQEKVNEQINKTIPRLKTMKMEVEFVKLATEDFGEKGELAFEKINVAQDKLEDNLRTNLAPVIKDVMTGGIKDVEDLGDAIGSILVTALATATAGWIATGIAAAAAGVTMAAALWPITAIALGLAAVILLADELKAEFEDTFGPLVDKLKEIGSQLVELFGGMENIKKIAAVMLTPLVQSLKSIAFVIGLVLDMISELIEGLNKLKNFELKEFVTGGGGGPIEKAIGINLPFFNFADGGIGSGFGAGIISQPTFNARGNQMAGEAGAEAIIPLKNGAVPVTIQGGGESNQPIQVNVMLDGKTLGRAMFDLSQRKAMSFDPGALLNRESIG